MSACECFPQRSNDEFCMSINPEKVHSALEKGLYSETDKPISPLIGLLIVDEYLDDPDWPCTYQIREFAVHDILTGLIRENFTAHRRIFGLPEIRDCLSSREALCAILEDVKVGSVQLLGWSWLYYHYVLVDLNITSTKYAELCSVTERTLRRYQYQTIGQLTIKLMQKERAALHNRRIGKMSTNQKHIAP